MSSGLTVPHLRNWRLWAVLSQEELGELAGVATITILQLENGRTARFETIGKLAKALGVSRRQLVAEAPKQEIGA